MRLFDVAPLPSDADLTGLSADRRRTIQQRQTIEAGMNPATREALRVGDETCGSCGHLVRYPWRSKAFYKCELVEVTHGPGTDVRKWWPACVKWVPTRDSTGGALIDELIR